MEREPERRALVIGNANYKYQAPLRSAETDAVQMRGRLLELNFKVDPPLEIRTKQEFSRAVSDFLKTIQEGDLVVFYYSGHGFSYGAEGFLAPLELPQSVSETNLPDTAMPVDSVRSLLEVNGPGMVIMIIDACRTIGDFIISPDEPNQPNTHEMASGGDGDSESASQTPTVNLARPGLGEPRGGSLSINSLVALAAQPGWAAMGSSERADECLHTRALDSSYEGREATNIGISRCGSFRDHECNKTETINFLFVGNRSFLTPHASKSER